MKPTPVPVLRDAVSSTMRGARAVLGWWFGSRIPIFMSGIRRPAPFGVWGCGVRGELANLGPLQL